MPPGREKREGLATARRSGSRAEVSFRPARNDAGLVRWCEVVVEAQFATCVPIAMATESAVRMNARPDARVDRVALDVGGEVVVARDSSCDGREVRSTRPSRIQL